MRKPPSALSKTFICISGYLCVGVTPRSLLSVANNKKYTEKIHFNLTIDLHGSLLEITMRFLHAGRGFMDIDSVKSFSLQIYAYIVPLPLRECIFIDYV